MIYNYLKLIIRNFMNDRLYTFIIVTGLAVGLSCCLVIAQYIQFELSFDKQYKNGDRIFYTYMRWESAEGEFDNFCHPSIGPLIKRSVPEASAVVRICSPKIIEDEWVLRRQVNGAPVFSHENGMCFADPEILTFFSIPMLSGNPATALLDPSSIVITESLGKKLFPGEKAFDKTITIQFLKEIREYKVTGIMEDLKPNSSLQFNALFSTSNFRKEVWGDIDNRWTFPAFETFIKIPAGIDPAVVERKINDAARKHLTELEKQYEIKESIRLNPYSQHHFFQFYNNWGIDTVKFTGDKRLIKFFGILAALILIISWANYINLTTARALRRAREVGLRKVNGASRKNIIFQFLTEFLFLNIISMLVALTIAQIMFPQFALIISSKAQWNFWSEPLFWIIIIVFIIFSTIASGFYPAFLMSNYNPSKVLKSNFNRSQSGTSIRKGLVLVQFGFSVFMLMSIYVISRQLMHMQYRDIGMIVDQVLVIRAAELDATVDRIAAFQRWKAKVQNLEYVKFTSAGVFYPGEKEWRTYFYLSSDPEKRQKAFRMSIVTSDYPNTMGLQLLSGKYFSDEPYDENKAVITETAAHELGFSDVSSAVGKLITLNEIISKQYEITGVVKDIRLSAKDNFFGEVLTAVDGDGTNNGKYFLVKVSTTDLRHTVAELEKQWKDLFPNAPFDYFFLDAYFAAFYKEEQQFSGVFGFFSFIGILITCMGLFGLSLYETTSRTKEIGIRKSVGGTSGNIIWLFLKNYIKMVITAALIGIPLGYWLLDKWLRNYPDRISLHADVVLLPMGMMIAIALLTVGYQTFKAANMDPVQSLKSE